MTADAGQVMYLEPDKVVQKMNIVPIYSPHVVPNLHDFFYYSSVDHENRYFEKCLLFCMYSKSQWSPDLVTNIIQNILFFVLQI